MSTQVTINDVSEGQGLKYLEMLGNEVVNETKNPNDKHHLGQLFLRTFRLYPDHVLQIDANTGESETNASFARRTIRAALGLRSKGLKYGDVVVIMGPNHIHLTVPLVACLYDGIIASPIDRNLKEMELTRMFGIVKPKLIFCQHAYTPTLKTVMKKTGIRYDVITFDRNDGEFDTLEQFLGEEDEQSIQNFTPAKFDPTETIAVLYSTSGTTGMSKSAAMIHKPLSMQLVQVWNTGRQYPRPLKTTLLLSPLQWASGLGIALESCMCVDTKVQTSAETVTPKLIMEMIDKYKPRWTILTPAVLNMINHHPDVDKYDLTSLETCHSGGMAVNCEILEQFVKRTKGQAHIMYATTESGSPIFKYCKTKPNSLGIPYSFVNVKLVDLETGKEVGVNEPGELVFKSEYIFKEYHNSPEATKTAFTEDGYLKSGDVLYRDADNYFYYVDREKFLLKYSSHQISPSELEVLIKTLPGVIDVGVTGVPHPGCGAVVVAFVVRSDGAAVTEKDITDLVEKNLAPSKRLRGGVYFVESLPMTSTAKLDRNSLKELAINTVDIANIDSPVEISPSELEVLIKTLPGVIDVGVTGVPHPGCGAVVVAFVVRSDGAAVTEKDITDLVEKNLAPSKRLRGGVYFVESLPMTSTAKLDRNSLKELAINTVDIANIDSPVEMSHYF